jgi:hypothetical protein
MKIETKSHLIVDKESFEPRRVLVVEFSPEEADDAATKGEDIYTQLVDAFKSLLEAKAV